MFQQVRISERVAVSKIACIIGVGEVTRPRHSIIVTVLYAFPPTMTSFYYYIITITYFMLVLKYLMARPHLFHPTLFTSASRTE